MFSILNEVLQKLEDGSPKAKLIFDFIIRLFQNKNDKSIVLRCFLRDFVGANDSGRFYYFMRVILQKYCTEGRVANPLVETTKVSDLVV